MPQKETIKMKIGLISTPGNRIWHDIVETLAPLQDRIEVHVYAPDQDIDVGGTDGNSIIFSDSLESNLSGADMVINLIGCQNPDHDMYRCSVGGIDIELRNSRTISAMLGGKGVWEEIDRLCIAMKDAHLQNAVIINAGGMPDIVTAYLQQAHQIISFGISRKADLVVKTLLGAISVNEHEGALACKLAGVCDHLWVSAIKDPAGRDIYPRLREKVGELDLDLTRNDLTRDGLRSMKFYGYYHSANVPDQPAEEIIFKLIHAYLSTEETTVYLNAINGDSINGLDMDAIVEIPFIFGNCKMNREKVNLPFPCVLVIDDLAGAVILTVKALVTRSVTMFKRALKLDPYLAPLLTLAELEDLADDILRRGDLAGFFKEE